MKAKDFEEIIRTASDEELARLHFEFSHNYPKIKHPEDQKIMEMLNDEVEIRDVERKNQLA
jgi:hypothetical protein